MRGEGRDMREEGREIMRHGEKKRERNMKGGRVGEKE